MSWTFKPALLLTTGRTIGFAVTFFIPIILVRIFDQAEFGTYKQLFLIYTTLYLTAQLGMAESLFYFLPTSGRKGGRYLANALLLLGVTGGVSWALLAGTESKISTLLSNSRLTDYMTLIGLYIGLMMVSSVLEITLISRKRYSWATVTYAVSDLVRAVCFIVPVFLFRELGWLLIGATVFALLRLVVALFYIKREYPGEFCPDRKLLKKQLKYALPFGLAGILSVLETQYHQYAVAHYFDAATFAIYSIGVLQIPLVDFLSHSASNVLMVGMKEALDKDDRSMVLTIWHDTTRKLALLLFPVVGMLLVLAPELIIFLFTESYRASVPIFVIWMMVILLTVLQTDGVIRVYAETRFLFLLYAGKLALIVLLLPWFVRTFHLRGAVLVTGVAILLSRVVALARMKKLMSVRIGELLPWRSVGLLSLSALVSGLTAFNVKSLLALSEGWTLLFISVLYASCYLALLLALGLIHDEEKMALVYAFQRWVGWQNKESETSV